MTRRWKFEVALDADVLDGDEFGEALRFLIVERATKVLQDSVQYAIAESFYRDKEDIQVHCTGFSQEAEDVVDFKEAEEYWQTCEFNNEDEEVKEIDTSV